MHMGHRLKGKYPDGQLYVDLLGQSESPRDPIAILIDFLVYGFGLDPQQLPFELEALRGVYLSQLNGKKILVVLDNALDGAQVEALLPGMGCGALVTSREKLTGLAGLTAQSFVPIDVMPIEDAIALLNQLCPEKTTDADLVTTLATLCGRLPLALTIVGRLLFGTASLTLAKLVAELGKERSRLRLLKVRNTRDESNPKLDVEASFNLSYRQLLPEQQQVFVAASVLRGADFGLELAAVLVPESQVQQRLDQLVTLALVQMPEGAIDRYRLHDLMREFGRGKLETEQEELLTGRALEWYGTTADQMDDFVRTNIRSQRAASIAESSEQSVEEIDRTLLTVGLAWFEVEWLNILEGIRWAKTTERAEISVRLFACGMHFAGLQGQRNLVLLEVGELALDAARGANDRLGEANTLQAIGDVLQFLKQSQDALNRYETAIDIYRQVGDRLGEANTLSGLGKLCFEEENYLKALSFYRERIRINQEIGNQYGEAWTQIYVGQTLTKLDQKWDAKTSYEAARQIFQSIQLMDLVEFCDNSIQELSQVTSQKPARTKAPTIGDDLTPRKKKRSFPLWQSALVLLLLGMGWQVMMRPPAPASQNGEVRMQK